MRLLALETSGTGGSVAALDGQSVLAQVTLEAEQRSGRMLHPATQQLLAQVGWQPRQVDVVAVTVGPGSFTGLRIGVTTAKTFCYATGARLVAINTLDCLAAQVDQPAEHIATVIDAYRNQLFACRYRGAQPGVPTREGEPAIVDVDAWLAGLKPGDVMCGAVLAKLRPRLPAGVIVAPESAWEPRAAMVGQLAMLRAEQDLFDDPWKVEPDYLRPSAAEEKRAQKG